MFKIIHTEEINGIVHNAKGDLNGTQGSVNSGIESLIAADPVVNNTGGTLPAGVMYSGVLFTSDGRVFKDVNFNTVHTYTYVGQWVDTNHTGDPSVYPGGSYAVDGTWAGGSTYTISWSAPQNTTKTYGTENPTSAGSQTLASDMLFRQGAGINDGGPQSDFWYVSITNNGTGLSGPTTIGSTTVSTDAIIPKGTSSAVGTCLEISTPLYVNGVMATVGDVQVGDVLIGGTFPGMLDTTDSNWMNWTTTDISGGTQVDATVVNVVHVDSTGYYKINNVKSTPSHKYFAKDTNGVWGWVRADDMTTAHKVYHKDFGQINVSSVTFVNDPYTYAVINVENVDTYFAGSLSMLHHNAS